MRQGDLFEHGEPAESLHHAEYYLMTENPRSGWDYRFYVIAEGGMRLVKDFFTKYVFPTTTVEGRCSYRELRFAIRAGNKKAFWYVFDKTNTQNEPEYVCKYVVSPHDQARSKRLAPRVRRQISQRYPRDGGVPRTPYG